MENTLENSKCLASLAVFRELYDNQKDVYGVISEFLKEIISSENKYQFGLTEITLLLNESYDFKIPEAVVKTSLSRLPFLSKSNGVYSVNKPIDQIRNKEFQEKQNKIYNSNNNVVNRLFIYIESQKKVTLSEAEKEIIVKSLCSFMLDESTVQEYSEYIGAFIVQCKSEDTLLAQLDTIKEGVVLYTGLKYNSNLNDLGTWNTQITIFIETEILFHFAGYNGELFKILFNDFFTFVKEINSQSINKNGKKKIHLKYFSEVKNEIERFFKKAEFIINGEDTLNPSKTAMASIVNGCKTPSDIIEKKALIYDLLKTNGITEDTYTEYYSAKNHKFNIEDQSIIESLQSSIVTDYDIRENLKFLNYVNILRQGASDRNFENIGYILLSGNATTIQLAWHDLIKPNGNVPLATTLTFLTNKLWFKLGKGFGKNNYPKTFDIITKAQIVLSTQVNDSISYKYDSLQEKLKKGELNEKQALATIVELRRESKKPEDIKADDLSDILDTISENNIEKYVQEQELFKIQTQKQKEENENLKKELSKVNIKYQQKEQTVELQNIKLKEYEQRILIIENDKIKDTFFKKRKEYQINRKKYVDCKLKSYLKESYKNILWYLIFIAIAFATQITQTYFKDIIPNILILSITFSAILFLVPFIRSFIKHDKILTSINYIFSKSKRVYINRRIIHDAILSYNHMTKVPIMVLKKAVDEI